MAQPQSTDPRGESQPPITAQRRSAAFEGVHPAGAPPIDPGPRRQQGFIHNDRWIEAQAASVIEHPNRDKAGARSTKAVVVALLLASALLVAIVTAGGWTRIQGAKPLQIAYVLLYLVLAFYIARWRSGLLPVAAALAIVLALFAAISGPQWFDRNGAGFSDPALDSGLLGVLTLVLVPVQILLIVVAAQAFGQRWSVEVERAA
jgi:hypothetical protein